MYNNQGPESEKSLGSSEILKVPSWFGDEQFIRDRAIAISTYTRARTIKLSPPPHVRTHGNSQNPFFPSPSVILT